MSPHHSLAASALALFSAFPALAADKETQPVVVTATRFSDTAPNVAANVTVITREDIRNSGANSLPDVLGTQAGVVVSQLGGGPMGRDATVDMRGFGSTATSNTLILIDGQRVNPADMGSIIWSAIPLASVERVEIVRGSGSILYGDGATGGVINIITNKSGKKTASIAGTIGSYGYRGTDVQLSDGNDKAYYNLFANYASADGYRQNSQQDQQTASGRVGWLLDRGEVFTDFSVYKETMGMPGSIFSAAYRDDPRSTRFPYDTGRRDGYRLRPGVTYQIGDALTFESEVGIEHQRLQTANGVGTAYPSASDRDRDTVSFTPRLRWKHGLGGLASETVGGYDYYKGKVGSTNVGYANTNASQDSSAFYLQNITQFTKQIALTTGGRTQRMNQSAHQDGDTWTPAVDGNSQRTRNAYDIGLSYTEDAWRVYGKTGTTFRFANLDELFGYNNVTYTPFFAGSLKPQHGTINEVGGSVALGPVKLRTSIFRLELEDEIGYDGSNNVNLPSTRRDGGEIEADWKISERLMAKTSYAYVDARFRAGAFSGNAVPLVPHHQANAQLTWNTGATGSYSAIARYVGERRYGSDLANAQGMLAGYTRLDLQATWDFKPLTITAKVLNAFDKRYSPFAGYSSTYHDTYYYPADARSFFTTARYDF